jgi:peptidoglycan/xylan/chitin deacetylase (PgdA/CDA1 family)
MKSGRGGEAVRGERARRPPQKARAQAGNGYWPRNARCAVCLTFDFDADSRFGDQPDSGLTTRSRGVYGARVGIYRILDLLRRYDLPATFFVPGYTAETYRDATVAIVRGGHELANHGYFHERPTDFSGDPEAELAILHRGSDALAAFAGSRPLGYRSPAWDLNPGSPKLLSRAGFIYDSSLMDDERPYLIDTGESAPLGYYETGGCFILTMHPQVIGRHHRLKVLERLIQYMMRRRRRLFISNCLDVAHHALNHSPLSAG